MTKNFIIGLKPNQIIFQNWEKTGSFFSRDSTPCRVGQSVGPSVTFSNRERFLHFRSCPTVRDCPVVYPALFSVVSCSWRGVFLIDFPLFGWRIYFGFLITATENGRRGGNLAFLFLHTYIKSKSKREHITNHDNVARATCAQGFFSFSSFEMAREF